MNSGKKAQSILLYIKKVRFYHVLQSYLFIVQKYQEIPGKVLFDNTVDKNAVIVLINRTG